MVEGHVSVRACGFDSRSGHKTTQKSEHSAPRGTPARSYLYSVLKKFFPILEWLPNYKLSNLKADIPAGITVGIMLIPQGMAYAMIAGLPVEFGLYAALIPQVIYALTGTSRHLAVGPVAMDSLLVAAGLTTISVTDQKDSISIAILLAFMMGIIQFTLGILRAGFLVNFLSKPIISGFTSAAAIIIAANQISYLTNVKYLRTTRLQDFTAEAITNLPKTHTPTLVIGVTAIVIIIALTKLKSRIKLPSALIVVTLGTFSVYYFDMQMIGIDIIREIPSGLPEFTPPNISSHDIYQLIPISLTLALVAFMEAYSISKSIEEKYEYEINPNQELRALGLANIFGSFFQSYPTTGGFSRTAVNEQAGASTPISSLIAASLIAITLLFFTELFFFLPKTVLAAIIITAVLRLIDFKLPISLLKSHKTEALLLLATFLTTLFIGMVEGITTGIILSVAGLVYRKMNPHFAELCELGELDGVYRNKARFPEAKIREGVLIIRFDAPLNFANHKFLKESIKTVLEDRPQTKSVILCAESISYIDASGISALESIINDIDKSSIDFRLAAAIGPVRDAITASKLISRIGVTKCFTSIKNALEDLDNPGAINVNTNKIATQSEIG